MDRFDPQFSAADIAPNALVRLCAYAAERRVDVEPWFLGTGVLPGRLDAPEMRVSYRQAITIIRRAVRAMPDGPHGLAIGARNPIVGFGILGFAMRSCRTVADAAQLANDMHRLAGCLTDFEVERRGEAAAVRVVQRVPDPEVLRFLTEQAMAAACAFGRSLLNQDFESNMIRLAYPEPRYAADYSRFFRCPVEFDCAVSEIVFPAELFARPIPTYSKASLAFAIDACRRAEGIDQVRHDIVASVESILGRNLRSAMSMAEVAARLLVTERTLRRRLQDAGEKFSDIRDRVRQRRARYLIEETAMTIAQIATETGYSDAREFRRAYVRWNGEPPSRTRRSAGAA
ncbi:AraC family transcriptional regulator [Nocardia brasiliensis]|uniref:AraC family transcriptional regulator n=1 Tax=Nocardia brasiliensis TaxID=37326 RepID=UPI0024546574|nr:AraC family transcriptional regulator [Nocardia brasiliensis]